MYIKAESFKMIHYYLFAHVIEQYLYIQQNILKKNYYRFSS